MNTVKDKPVTSNPDKVICPSCCYQFRAIPQNVQRLMLGAGFEPPFMEPVAAQEPSSPGAFEEWYDTKFKHGFERGPNDKYVARKAWFAALYDHAAPCARCAELERLNKSWKPVCDRLTGTDNLAIESPVDYVEELFNKITEQAERIKALEEEDAEIHRLKDATINMQSDKLAKADAVILHLKETCKSGIWAAGSDFVAMSVWRIKESLAAIEQYQKGE